MELSFDFEVISKALQTAYNKLNEGCPPSKEALDSLLEAGESLNAAMLYQHLGNQAVTYKNASD